MNKINTKIRLVIFFVFSFIFLNASILVSQNQSFTVVLDAGHGGHDPGNVGNGYREKNIVLNVVKEVGNYLQKEEDIRVIYTRDTDIFIDLWKRSEIANKAKANLFVSIHCDAHNSDAYGSSTFVLGLHANKRNFEVAKRENAVISLEKNFQNRYKGFDPNSEESFLGLTLMQEENLDKSFSLAADIQSNFSNSLNRRNRGVKQAGFVVLHQTYMPSVLIELGFLTNKNEGKFLNSKSGQQKMAKEIAKSIIKYQQQLKLNTIDVEEPYEAFTETNNSVNSPKNISKNKEVIFKVQIASSKKKIKEKPYNFRGLKNVERVKVGLYYKYYYGLTKSYEQAKVALSKAKKKGYSDGFIAAFKGNERVSLKDILK